jgi:hypothetical protein
MQATITVMSAANMTVAAISTARAISFSPD